MGYFSFSSSYRSYNEDRVFVNDSFGFILDGANSLCKQERLISDSTWFVDEWKTYLETALLDKNETLKTIVRNGIEVIKKRFLKYINGQNCEEFPSCSMSIFRINKGELEYFMLGDSPMLITTIYGNTYEFVPEDVRRWSVTNQILLKNKAIMSGIDMVDAKRKFGATLLAARKKKNTSGDFHVAADYPMAVEFATFGSLPKKEIKKITIMSDGYAEAYYLFKIATKEQINASINSYKDAEKLYKKLIKEQQKDFLCNKYLRFKRTDDSSIIGYEF